MKKVLLIVLLFVPVIAYAQNDSIVRTKESILLEVNEAVQAIRFNQEELGRYKIYQTDNIYILIKLDTATGIIKLVQWSLDKDEEFEAYVNSEDLSKGVLCKKGRFELYPTKNIYQFVLLDTVMGSTWHVQWSTKRSQMWIRLISYF